MGHRRTVPMHVDPRPAFRRIVWLHGTGNLTSGLALMFGDPGVSGTLALITQFIPLAMLGAVLFTAGTLQVVGDAAVVWGHGIGAAAWLFISGSALITVMTGTQTSGAGALLLAGLLVTVAGLHLNGILFRRQEAISARAAAARRGEK